MMVIMIEEAITLGAILGASAIAVWFAKVKFQPEIERNLAIVEAHEEKEKSIIAK
jgi:hypothetical protein